MVTTQLLDEDDSSLDWAPGFGFEAKAASRAKGTPDGERPVRVLLVEDNSVDANLVQRTLRYVAWARFEVVVEATLAKATERLAEGGFQVVLLDLNLPDSSGLDTLLQIRERVFGAPIIVLTGVSDEEIAVHAIQQGAQDFLVKGADALTMTRAIRYAISRQRLRRRLKRALDVVQASEANQRMLIADNLDGIVVVDGDGRAVFANTAAEALFGLPSGTLVGKRFPVSVIPGSTKEIDIVNFGGQVVPTELRVRTIDWNGKSASFVLLRDLTERRLIVSSAHKMELARQVQQRLFPKSAPILNGFEIAGAAVTADQTGGDYFDYVPMPDGTIGVVVADASGHGMAAALVITAISAYVRAFSSLTNDPGEILSRVSGVFHSHTGDVHFVTAVLASFDPLRRTIRYASAGHPSVLIIGAEGEMRADLTSLDLPIGINPEHRFQCSPVNVLQKGDTVVLMSDGILEAQRRDGSLFGKNRMIEQVRLHRSQPAQSIAEALISAARHYSAPQLPADDMTVVIVKVV